MKMHQWILACEDWHGFNFGFPFFFSSYYNLTKLQEYFSSNVFNLKKHKDLFFPTIVLL